MLSRHIAEQPSLLEVLGKSNRVDGIPGGGFEVRKLTLPIGIQAMHENLASPFGQHRSQGCGDNGIPFRGKAPDGVGVDVSKTIATDGTRFAFNGDPSFRKDLAQCTVIAIATAVFVTEYFDGGEVRELRVV